MAKKSSVHVTPASLTRKWIKGEDMDAICKALEEYTGDVAVLEGAIGALLVGRVLGYNALRVVHSWRTLRNYEGILHLRFAEVLPETTADSDRVNGIRWAKQFKAFWKALGAGVGSQEGAKNVIGRESVVK